MLRFMRERATNWLIKLLLGAIVVVFVFWGVGSFRSQRFNRVALVNGEPIAIDDFRDAYNSLLERLRQQLGNQLNEEMLKTLRLKEQALNQLINNRLLVQEAHKLKFRISDQELADTIRDIGAFQRAGVFDSQLYNNVLNRLRMTPEQFETAQREAMLVDRLKFLITGSVIVSDLEIQEWYDWINASVNVDFVVFEPGQYQSIETSDQEIKAYFENNKDNYKTKPMVQVRYLQFRPEDYLSQVSVGDDDLKQYYNDYPEEFKKPKTVEARHILMRLDPSADANTVEAQRKKALDIYKMATAGGNFAELAKQYSEGPTKDRGGYLGTFQRESMVKPFSDKAFSMAAGEISEPVRTQFGWHIIKVEKVNAESMASLEEAKETIRNKLGRKRAKQKAYDQAEMISDLAYAGTDLVQAAAKYDLKMHTTDFFTEKGPGQGVGDPVKFASAAFDLQGMDVSDVQEFEDGYYLMQVVQKAAPEIPEFENVKDKVRADLLKEMQDKKAREDADAMLAALQGGSSFDAESQKYKLIPKSTGFFKRNESIPGIGFDNKINEAAFRLSETHRYPQEVIRSKQGYCIIQLKETKQPDISDLDAQKEKIKKTLFEQKTLNAFNSYLENIKSKSEITIKKEFLE